MKYIHYNLTTKVYCNLKDLQATYAAEFLDVWLLPGFPNHSSDVHRWQRPIESITSYQPVRFLNPFPLKDWFTSGLCCLFNSKVLTSNLVLIKAQEHTKSKKVAIIT